MTGAPPVQTRGSISPRPSPQSGEGVEGVDDHYAFKPHPMLALPDVDQMARDLAAPNTAQELLSFLDARAQSIRAEEWDAFRHGFEFPCWADARRLLAEKDEVFALGANGSGKTELAGKMMVEAMLKSGARVLGVTRTEELSKAFQQAAVFKYLPVEIRQLAQRGLKRDHVSKINYSQADGFANKTFVLPPQKPGGRGSQCWFKTVQQWVQDQDAFEGPEYDLVVIDEPVPLALLETLRYRVGKRGGKLLVLFTAKNGYDAVCAQALTGARLVKSFPLDYNWGREPAGFAQTGQEHIGTVWNGLQTELLDIPELRLDEEQVKGCPVGHMPYILQPLNERQAVICFWTQWNWYLPDLRAMFSKCVRQPKHKVRVRLFGWVEKIAGSPFPMFNPNVHVVPHERIEKMMKEGALTLYNSCDPATARSYFLLWNGVDYLGRNFIVDESPRTTDGEWVTAEGERGDGQYIFAGRGVDWYKQHIRRRERELFSGVKEKEKTTSPRPSPPSDGGEGENQVDNRPEWLRSSYTRVGDPRAFATEAASKEGGKSLMELFADVDPKDAGNPELARMDFEPARVGRRIGVEIEKINDLLSYDDGKPISVENEPHCYISDRCVNLITALVNWNEDQGEDSPYKDPIDTLRYLHAKEMRFIDPSGRVKTRGGGSY